MMLSRDVKRVFVWCCYSNYLKMNYVDMSYTILNSLFFWCGDVTVVISNTFLVIIKYYFSLSFDQILKSDLWLWALFRRAYLSGLYVYLASSVVFPIDLLHFHTFLGTPNNGASFGHPNPCGQFHQHFTSSFCADILFPKNYKAKL